MLSKEASSTILSIWYDSTNNWTLFSMVNDEHSDHFAKVHYFSDDWALPSKRQVLDS